MRFDGVILVSALRWTPVPLIGGALFYHTALAGWMAGESSYQRRVQEPVPVVAAVLKDIQTDDFDHREGRTGPQLDLPQIVRSETSGGIVWQIVKDGKVTAELTATLKPVDRGEATDVLGTVKLIDADNAVSARALQITLANALDAKLAELGPQSGIAAGQLGGKHSGDTGLTSAAILADPLAIARAGLEADLGELRMEREMQEQRASNEANPNVDFKPGQPMIDVDPEQRRPGH